jgi:hypothetical protein
VSGRAGGGGRGTASAPLTCPCVVRAHPTSKHPHLRFLCLLPRPECSQRVGQGGAGLHQERCVHDGAEHAGRCRVSVVRVGAFVRVCAGRCVCVWGGGVGTPRGSKQRSAYRKTSRPRYAGVDMCARLQMHFHARARERLRKGRRGRFRVTGIRNPPESAHTQTGVRHVRGAALQLFNDGVVGQAFQCPADASRRRHTHTPGREKHGSPARHPATRTPCRAPAHMHRRTHPAGTPAPSPQPPAPRPHDRTQRTCCQ